MSIIKYCNKYGSLELQLMTGYAPLTGVSFKTMILPLFPDCVYDMDMAERVALITDNRRLQISFNPLNLNQSYILHHNSPSTAAVCKIVSITFDSNINAQEELKRCARPYSLIH